MPAYLLANITVTDSERYKEYAALAGIAVAKYGGGYLVRGPLPEPLEEEWALERVAIIEFPDLEAVRTWYESPG